MRLVDLNPVLKGTLQHGSLRFDCPMEGHHHSILVPLGTSHWKASGSFPETLTIEPSINNDDETFHCWHGWIRGGEVVNA